MLIGLPHWRKQFMRGSSHGGSQHVALLGIVKHLAPRSRMSVCESKQWSGLREWLSGSTPEHAGCARIQ